MAKTIVVRGIPDRLHRKLTTRAAAHGLSLPDYVLAELRRLADRLPPRDLAARSRRIARADLDPSPADLLRAERDQQRSSSLVEFFRSAPTGDKPLDLERKRDRTRTRKW